MNLGPTGGAPWSDGGRSLAAVDRLSKALLYEGYLLYPYRPSSVKNRQRWSFGGLSPESWSQAMGGREPFFACTECLAEGDEEAALEVRLRFLHLVEAGADQPSSPAAAPEALEREIAVTPLRFRTLLGERTRVPFAFPAKHERSGGIERHEAALEGSIDLLATRLGERLFKLAVRVSNTTPLAVPAGVLSGAGASGWREAARLRSMASAHLVLGVQGGAFVSLLETPEPLRESAESCRQEGLWPVLVGDPSRRDTLVASPIILYDYPQIAPESPGDLFDATEIDEILTLRILTLTEAEKQQAAAADPRVRDLLARTEALGEEDRSRLHGTFRRFRFQPGDRVRLRPCHRADIMDIALAGRPATVQSVQEDFEGRTLLAVTVDDDPGRDLGMAGQPGHRFFFGVDEVDLLPEARTR